MKNFFFVSTVGLILATGLFAQTSVTFTDVVSDSLPPSDQKAFERTFNDVWGTLRDSETPSLVLKRAKMKPASGASVTTIVSGSDGSFSVVLQMAKSPSATPIQKYFSFKKIDDNLTILLSSAYSALLRPLEPKETSTATPILIDDFSPSAIRGTDIPVMAAGLLPYGLAQKSGGRLLVACYSTVIEMDDQFRVLGIPTKKLNDEGNMSYASSVLTTPGGTTYLRSLSSTEIFSFADGSSDYKKFQLPIQSTDTFGVFQDGSLFVFSPLQKQARIYQGKDTAIIDLSEDTYPSAAAAGPENTLWVFDGTSGALKVYFVDGRLKGAVFPDLSYGSVVMRLRILADGSFVAVTTTDIRFFDRNGKVLWIYDGKADAASLNFATLFDLVFDPNADFFFAVDVTSKKILRFWNPARPLKPEMTKLANLQRELRIHPDKTELQKDLAMTYRTLNSPEMALANLDSYTADHPLDSASVDERQKLQVALLKNKASAASDDVQQKLRQFGPETARETYARAMRTFETLQALAPDDQEIRTKKAALRLAFSQAENQDSAPPKQLPKIVSIDIAGLFPALMQYYRTRPAGHLVLKNTLKDPLSNVKVSFFLKKYMDFPAEGKEASSIAPGGEVSLDLTVVLNQSALDLQEDLFLQAQISVQYTTAQGPQTMELTRPVTLYRKTALTWDITAKMASFITPNEETVDLLTHKLVHEIPKTEVISPAFLRAVTLASALGAIPLRYVPSPHSPITEVLGNSTVVDTVRFPRTTLLYEGGDCSDTTALLCSLMESAGIPTALITTPGHIFMAFDTGERSDAAWQFQSPGYEVIVDQGEVWMPVETTVLEKGFAEAWKTASALVKNYRGTKDFEFIPVSGTRDLYPPLPLPPSTLQTKTPNSDLRSRLETQTFDLLQKNVYEVILKDLLASKNGLSGKNLSKQENKIALLQVRYGKDSEAEKSFQELAKTDPDFLPGLVNWANLKIRTGDFKGAADLAKKAKDKAPDSAAVQFLWQQVALAGKANDNTPNRAAGETKLQWLY